MRGQVLAQARKLAEAERQRAELEQCAAGRLRGLAIVMAVVAVFAVGASVTIFPLSLSRSFYASKRLIGRDRDTSVANCMG